MGVEVNWTLPNNLQADKKRKNETVHWNGSLINLEKINPGKFS